MAEKLDEANEIAIDLEHHRYSDASLVCSILMYIPRPPIEHPNLLMRPDTFCAATDLFRDSPA